MADPADILILGCNSGIVLLLQVDLPGQQVIFRFQFASLRHTADRGEQRGVRHYADCQTKQHDQDAAQAELHPAEDDPAIQQKILADGKAQIQQPFLSRKPVLIAVHQQCKGPHQKRVRR